MRKLKLIQLNKIAITNTQRASFHTGNCHHYYQANFNNFSEYTSFSPYTLGLPTSGCLLPEAMDVLTLSNASLTIHPLPFGWTFQVFQENKVEDLRETETRCTIKQK